MKVDRLVRQGGLLALALLGIVWSSMGCKRDEKASAATLPRAGGMMAWRMRRAKPAKPVHAAVIRRGEIEAILSGTATLEAEERVTILAQVKGLAVRVFGKEGRYFRKGSTLASLSNPYLKIADEQVEAEIEKAKVDLKRNRRLSKRGYISRETEELLAFQLRQKQIQRKQTQEDIRNLRIPATISGIVTKQILRRGTWIVPNAEVFMMEDPRSLVATIAVPEKYLSYLKTGLEGTLFSEALGVKTKITGKVVRISPTVDAKTGTIQVIIGELSPLEKLRSGMFVAVRLVLERRKDVPLIPKQAVLYENNAPVVYRLLGKKGACDVNLSDLKSKGAGARGDQEGGEKKGRGGRWGSMTPEQRAAMRKRMASMTPEQRAEMRKKWRKRRGKKDGGGDGDSRPRWRSARGGSRWGGKKGRKGGKGARCRVQKVRFDKGLENERAVEVIGGLKAGDRVVTLGQEDLQKGAAVRVVKLD
ncbi:MAG: efflux RND transporter periplasmic adaptor subunit [Myxococcales bacterium]|nr:efflux RND transporter periplasmic adaptor subunit [Myxococcales bacterium]MCB9643845.1 efflux RND transporter periplasmic adaptor subunit [Myxococcales bacterium]